MRGAVIILASATLCGCASAPKVWIRADGAPIAQTQLQLDQTACQGEVQKAALSEREQHYYLGPDTPFTAIFAGCMADRGYLAAKN